MRHRAFTLIETLLYAILLGIVVAALVRETPAGLAQQRLELAANEVAAALRYAHGEALRTGRPHGARIAATDHRVRVYLLDDTTPPPVEQFSVLHPVDRRLYDLGFGSLALTEGVRVTSSDFRFGGDPTPKESVAFDPTGNPVSPVSLVLMDQGRVDLACAGYTRAVVVSPRTGRVTVE